MNGQLAWEQLRTLKGRLGTIFQPQRPTLNAPGAPGSGSAFSIATVAPSALATALLSAAVAGSALGTVFERHSGSERTGSSIFERRSNSERTGSSIFEHHNGFKRTGGSVLEPHTGAAPSALGASAWQQLFRAPRWLRAQWKYHFRGSQ